MAIRALAMCLLKIDKHSSFYFSMAIEKVEKYARTLSDYKYEKNSVVLTLFILVSVFGVGYAIFALLSLSTSATYDAILPEPDNFMNWTTSKVSTPVKAAFVALVREADLFELRRTMRMIEDRFNQQHLYPWIILSDQPFTIHFQEWVQAMTPSPVYFGQAPANEWHEPYWIDMKRAEVEAMKMYADGVFHGESLTWRKMTR